MNLEELDVEKSNKEIISKLYKVYKTLCKMMYDRGYDMQKDGKDN